MPDGQKITQARPSLISNLRILTAFSLSTVSILILLAVFAAQMWNPDDDGNYAITTLGAVVSGLNVLFTLWLLRTAQTQLDDARRDAAASSKSMQEQEKQLRSQLEQARQSHDAERSEAATSLLVARDAVDEALRARVDQLAPRVSFVVSDLSAWIIRRDPATRDEHRTQLTSNETLTMLDDDNVIAVDVSISWTLKNWGEEPVSAFFPAPFIDHPSVLLMPMEEKTIRYPKIRTTKSFLHEIANNGHRFDRTTSPIVVQVQDLGGQVHDNLEWTADLRPVMMDGSRFIFNEGWNTRVVQYGVRRRHYSFLEGRAHAEADASAGS